MQSIFGDFVEVFNVPSVPTCLGMRITFTQESLRDFGPDGSIYLAFDLADTNEFIRQMQNVAKKVTELKLS